MKNIFKLFAVVALGLFATSCATDLTDDLAVGGGDVTVSFTAGVPTRAISDGTKATDLYVTVYAHRGSEYLRVTEKTAELVNLSATVNLDFVQGGTYTIIFWAQNEDCDYTLTWGDNGATVDMNYNGVANAENKDAFYAVKTLTINGPANHPVTLTRPFAQLNVGTSDLAKAQLLNFELASVVVEAQAYRTLNLLTGEASNKQYVSFAYTATNGELPEQDGLNDAYDWLSYNYILVGSQDETLDSVKATIAQKYGNAREITEYNVPVKRNYRTNLVGALLTTQNGFNVELAPGMEGEYQSILVNSAAGLQAAIDDAGAEPTTIVLSDDLVLGPGSVIMDGALSRAAVNQDITIDLNGKTITAKIPDVTSSAAIFNVKKGQKLTIQGEGTINCEFNKATNCSALLFNNEAGELVINGGTYTMNAPASWQECLNPLFVDTNTTLGAATTTINGGTFTWTRNLFRNFSNSAVAPAKLVINGGTFNGAADNTGCIWNQKPSASIPTGAGVVEIHGGVFNNMEIWSGWTLAESVVFDAAGYALGAEEQDSGEWGAVILGPTEVSTWAEFTYALENGAKIIKLTEDIIGDVNEVLTIANGTTINLDLNGKTLSSTNTRTETHNDFILVKGTLNVMNGTITYEHTGENMGWNGCTNLFDITAGGILNMENVVANNLGGTDMNFAAHLNNWGEVTLNADNCEFLSTYCGVRLFNSGYDMNNVTISNSKLTGATRAFWVHNFTNEGKDSSTLNVNIFNRGNIFEITGEAVSPIRYGFTDASYYIESENAIYFQTPDAVTISSYSGTEADVVLPNEVNGMPITVLGGYIFNGKTLNSVVLPNAVKIIGNRAFRKTNITSGEVVLPESVTTLEEGAFQGASHTTITIPENVTYMGKQSIGYSSTLETIIIKAKHPTICNYVARACANLKSVYIYSDDVTFDTGSMYFTNTENADASAITFYVNGQALAEKLFAAMSTSSSYGLKIVSLDGATTYYNTLK